MLTESNLKVGDKYLYWSASKQCHTRVVYEGKRIMPWMAHDVFVFRDSLSLNEIWTENLISIVVDDDGWLEKFVNEKEDDNGMDM